MKKYFSAAIVLILLFTTLSAQKSFYDLKAETIEGKTFDFSTLKGKKVLIVNTASRCGYTNQYKDLESLNQLFGGMNLVIIGFPSNDFMFQEPGTNEEIMKFCSTNYNVTFQMMSKISVKDKNMHPVYKWLTSKVENGVADSKVKWNFHKYLVSETGQLVKQLESKVSPLDSIVIHWLKN